MTTTTTDKMLARADELEARARALRLAAAEMNGHAIEGKREGMHMLVANASKLRAQQNGNGNGNGPTVGREYMSVRDRDQLIIAFLRDGGKSVKEIQRHLEAQGEPLSNSAIQKNLKRMGVQLTGARQDARWQLPASGIPTSQPSELEEGLTHWAATKVRRAAKNEQIVAILREHGKPMKVKALAAAAREAGIPGITGIAGLVQNGTLRSRGTGPKRTYALAT
jgi:DNA-binding transcriptional MerR regulator